MNDTNHIRKYINYHNQYVKKYGENTVIFMQTGSHFNIFAVINDEINDGPDIYNICTNILNNSLQVTRQNKSKPEVSYKNCLMAGFPLYSVNKYENMLLDNNFTAVIVEQITPPPNTERGVTRIISPGTTIDNPKHDSNYLMSIYVEKNIYQNNDVYIVGCSIIDLSTGKNYLHSIISKLDDDNYWNDEISRFIHFYNPSEIIFHFKNFEFTNDEIIQNWDISHNSIQINHYNDKNLLKNSYQNDFLQKVFKLNSMLSPIEYFDLELKPELVISYIYLLQYVKDHRVDTLQNIEKPEIVNDTNFLSLTSNSIRQLNIVNNYSYFKGKNESLLSVTNACVTSMGRRLFKERLLYPSIDPEIINYRYDLVDLFRNNNFYETIIPILRKVNDLEKSLRKMGLGLIQPNEFYSDKLSFEFVNKILTILNQQKSILEKLDVNNHIKRFEEFYQKINENFNFLNFTSTKLERSIFNINIDPQLDEYDEKTKSIYKNLNYIRSRISKLIDNSDSSVKLDYDERNNWFIYCTHKRSNVLKERLNNLGDNNIHVKNDDKKNIFTFKPSEFDFKKKDSSSMIIVLNSVKSLSSELIDIQDKLVSLNREKYKKTIEELYNEYHYDLKQFYLFLSEVDVYCSCAKISIQNCYHRPKIVDSEKSFIDIKDIRHPIVERIHTNTEYITNDVHLGKKDEKDGILLFGTNACGKSTFMKAVGLNIIMAQAGMFVSASSFIYKPYNQIFTRILNNDNIFRSQSSFAVEIQELKSILKRADSNSLVLGDELCSGTESVSALSIIGAGLNTLCKRKTSFIFTSHLHQLTKLDEITSIENLKIYHLKIHHDVENDILIYDRKLEEGSGPSIYGLKVCEAMGMSSEFISIAKNIQSKLEKDNINTKKSQYNKNVFMDECKICFAKDSQLETHHIKDQQFADKNNIIDHHHKNIKHNLVPLCKACHLKVTNHELIVSGWKETNQGRILNWSISEKKIQSKKKFNEKTIQIILELREINDKLSQKDFLKKIELENNIKCSISTFKKIIDKMY